MTFWNIDNAEYRQAYEQTVNQFELISSLTVSVSAPEFIPTTLEYEQSEPRLLILGQETLGNTLSLADQKPWTALANSLGGYIHFDFAAKEKVNNSPFWRAYRDARHHFDVPFRGSAWANISSVQRTDRESAFSTIPNEEQIVIAKWQRALFNAMLNFVKPNHILSLTGPNYDWLLNEMIPDLKLTSVNDLPFRQIACGVSEEFNLKIVRTYHPGYLNRDAVGDRWSLLRQACEQLKV